MLPTYMGGGLIFSNKTDKELLCVPIEERLEIWKGSKKKKKRPRCIVGEEKD